MCKILLLDAEQVIFPVIEAPLRAEFESCEFIHLEDTSEVRSVLQNSKPNVFIATMHAANLSFSGINVIMLARETCPEVPVVIIGNNGLDDCRNAVLCIRAGASDYLSLQDISKIGPVIRDVLDRQVNLLKKASEDESLRISGQKWRITFDAISAPFAVTDAAGLILRANKAFKGLVNKDWNQIIGSSLDSVSIANDCDVESVASMINTDVRQQVTRCRIGALWYRKTSERIYASDGSFEQETHFYEDITKSVSLEKILVESEHRYHGFFDTISMGIIFIDKDGRIKDINATGCSILGVDRDSVLSMTLENLGLAAFLPIVANLQSDSGSYTVKEKICTIKKLDDNSEKFLKITIQPIFSELKESSTRFFVIFEDISDQKKERDDLLTSEIRYHQLLDVAPVGIFVLSERIVTFCNKQAATILGADNPALITGYDFDRLLSPETRADDQLRLEKTISGEWVKYPVETVYLKLDGTPIDVEVIKARIPYSHGNAELVIFNDITARKKNELIRKNMDAQMQALFQSAPLTMMVVDGDFNVRNINALNGEKTDTGRKMHPCENGLIRCSNAAKKSGKAFDETQCETCHLKSAVLATLHTGLELHNREIEMSVVKDTIVTKATYLLHASRIDSFGEPLCILVLNDVTGMKNVQDELEQTVTALKVSQERNRRHSRWIKALYSISREITQCTSVASMISVALSFLEKLFAFRCACVAFPDNDETMNIVQGISKRGAAVNRRIGIIVGERFDTTRLPEFFSKYESGKVEVFSLLDDPYIGDDYWAGFKALSLNDGLTNIIKVPFVADKVKQGLLFLEYDFNVKLSKDEKLFLVDLAGNIGMALSNFGLYKELRDSYEKLEQAIRSMDKQRRLEAMGKVASGITHDINNTLVPIKLYTEALLEREKGLSEKGLRYLTLIQKSANDIENVTSRLRSFYKGADYTELEPVDVPAVIADVNDMTMPKWKDASNRKGINIRLEIASDEHLPKVSANASELREALMNLVFNAVDAMPSGGIITLSSRIDDDSVRISVEDTGTGMSKETLERCMEPFFTTKGSMGTGLGLAEVYGSIKRFKGKIDIQSELGKGTSIIVHLPLFKTQSADIEIGIATQPTREMSILLVDDDSRILEVVTEMLSLDGHSVMPFQSALGAIGYLEENTDKLPDLIITDLGMPEMDGNAFAKKAKDMHPDLPVLLMTGWGKLLGNEIKQDWIDAVINKPPNLEMLRSAIQTGFRHMTHKGRKP